MATRFGGTRPSNPFASRLRIIVGVLAFVILSLLGTITFLLVSSNSTTASQQVENEAPSAGHSSVEILIARSRIEQGQQITEDMLEVQAVHPERIPEGAILASQQINIIGKYAETIIRPHLPLMQEDISERQPISSINIPKGFRAVTIHVDQKDLVEGWARPNSRVDVLWTFADRDGTTKIATIVRFVKILSVGGPVQPDQKNQGGPTTASLLVAERDAKKIELARRLGTITLSLVGDTDELIKPDGAASTLDIYDLLETEREDTKDVGPVEGKMIVKNPTTGQEEVFVLRRGKWVRDGE